MTPTKKQDTTWLKEVNSIALQSTLKNLADAFSRFFKKQNDVPQFNSKNNKVQSYTTKHTNGKIAIVNNKIKLSKRGLVTIAKSREVDGRILNATVRRNPSGKYFVSIPAETEVQEMLKTESACGVDVGLKDFAILSSETKYASPKFFRTLEEKLGKTQRILTRRKKGSSNWNKQQVKVTRIHERISLRVNYSLVVITIIKTLRI